MATSRMRSYCFVVMGIVLVIAIGGGPTAAQSPATTPLVMLIDGDIWTYAPDEWRQVTTQGVYQTPILAPDGRQIAFVGPTPEFAAAPIVGDTPPQTEVWVMDLPEGDPSVIASQDGQSVAHSQPDYSPDARLLAWTELRLAASWFYQVAVYDRASGEISRADIQFTEIPTGYPQAPLLRFVDNETVALTWFGEGRQVIGAFNLAGESASEVVGLEGVTFVADFFPLPDGTLALFDGNRWGQVDFAAGLFSLLDGPRIYQGGARILAHYRDTATAESKWLILTDGVLEWLPYAGTDVSGVALSPDGLQIAYAVEGGFMMRGEDEIFIPHPDGLTPQVVRWSSLTSVMPVAGLPVTVAAICPDLPPSVLFTFEAGRVTTPDGLTIFDQAEGEAITHVAVDTAFGITGEYICGATGIWWQVDVDQVGWLLETEGNRYLVLPED